LHGIERAETMTVLESIVRLPGASSARQNANAGGDDEKAARILGVSLGAVRLAKRRHLDAATIGPRKKAT
jgi:hypothetical protein